MSEKKAIIFSLVVFVLGALTIGYFNFFALETVEYEPVPIVPEIIEPIIYPVHEIIGSSVEGRDIESFTYGTGETHIAFVGGIHGGYEWNSVLLAYTFMDYLDDNPDFVPESMTITIIPSANPDGIFKVIEKEGRFTLADTPDVADTTGIGRFNANDVDLNRNFDCKWEAESTWRSKVVSAGTEAFSEPEAQAIQNFVTENNPQSVIFFHSQSNAVYASECHEGVLPETIDIMNAYAQASGYKPVESFDAYPITGDAEGWLASINIPAITVELETHETVEWERNLAGIEALINYYTE